MTVLLVLIVGAIAVYFSARSLPPVARRLVPVTYGAHLAGAALQVWMHTSYYEGGDMLGYFYAGNDLAMLLRIDFGRWFPQILRLIFHRETIIPFYVLGQGGTSGTMVGIGGLIAFFTDDVRPLWPTCLLMGTTSTLAQVLLCKAGLGVFEPARHRSVALGMLLVPSVVFWSSALTKEGVALPFLALALYAAVLILKKRFVLGVIAGIVGAGGLGLVKGYILMPVILSIATAFFVARNANVVGGRAGGSRWALAAGGIAFAMFGLAAVSAVFPEYSPGSIVENTARYQQTYGVLEGGGYGGSNVDIGDIDVGQGEQTTLLGQLKFVPMATINALFRPLVFEARSIVQLLASMETTLVVALTLRLLLTRTGRRAFGAVATSPQLAFCAVFVFTFSVAVGLSTLNLGTLSRYRIPMMPFFAVMLIVLGEERRKVVTLSRESLRSGQLRRAPRPRLGPLARVPPRSDTP